MGLWELRIAGIVLVAGTVVFFCAVSVPLFADLSLRVWSAPLPEYLELIAAHRTAWLWTNGGIVVGVLLTTIGLAILTSLLNATGNRFLARVGLLLFVMGAMFWMFELTFRLSVTVWVAEVTANTGAPPSFFAPLQQWVEGFFFIYMVVAYLATAIYGLALLQMELLPNWLGWISLGAGVFGMISFVAGSPTIFSIPAGVQLVPLLIGIFLLVSANQLTPVK